MAQGFGLQLLLGEPVRRAAGQPLRELRVEFAQPFFKEAREQWMKAIPRFFVGGVDRQQEQVFGFEIAQIFAGAGIAADRFAQRTIEAMKNRDAGQRSEEHTSELQSLMRISYA